MTTLKNQIVAVFDGPFIRVISFIVAGLLTVMIGTLALGNSVVLLIGRIPFPAGDFGPDRSLMRTVGLVVAISGWYFTYVCSSEFMRLINGGLKIANSPLVHLAWCSMAICLTATLVSFTPRSMILLRIPLAAMLIAFVCAAIWLTCVVGLRKTGGNDT